MVMDGGHLHAVISSFPEIFVEGAFGTEHACELLRHGLPCTLCFLALCALKCWETKAKQRREEGAEALHEKQRMRIEALLR